MAALFVAVGIAAPQQPGEPTADFAFRYEFKPCETITLNTYTNVFTRLVRYNEPPITIPLKLSPQQIAGVYREILNIRFFEYPTDFKGVQPGPGGEVSTTTPSTRYRLEVRSAGMIHTVTYDNCCGPRSEEANRLLSLFNLINGFINDDLVVKSLPTPRVACM